MGVRPIKSKEKSCDIYYITKYNLGDEWQP